MQRDSAPVAAGWAAPEPSDSERAGASGGDQAKLLALEGFRGTLALLVCVGHLGLNTVAAKLGMRVHFELAVDVFFVLSGFILSYRYYFSRRSFPDLVAARIARLYPLHLITLVWMALVLPYIPHDFDFVVFAQNAALLHNIGLPPNIQSFNGASWSISVEMAASLAFYFVVRSGRLSVLFALLLLLTLVVTVRGDCFTGNVDNCYDAANSGLIRGAVGFCYGAVAYLAWQANLRLIGVLRHLAYPLLGVFAGMLLGPRHQVWFPVAFLIVSALCVTALAASGSSNILAGRVFVYLGTISYSIYLLHTPVNATLAAVLPTSLARGEVGKSLIMVSVLVASALSYHFVETPLKRAVLVILAPRREVVTADAEPKS